MNDTNETNGHVEPLDAAEREWVDVLKQDDADIAASEDAFVRAVMDRAKPTPAQPVLARIGWLPLATAAALLIAGAVAWSVFSGNGNTTDTPPIAEAPKNSPEDSPEGAPQTPGQSPGQTNEENTGDQTPAPRLAHRSLAERRAMAQQLQLGSLITQTSTTFSQPAASFPKTIRNTADQLTLKTLTGGITNPVPDPAQVLPRRRD